MSSTTWTFTPLDTWFFKQALAPDSLAAQELTSLFPPSPRTLIGALRAAVGEAHSADWVSYRKGNQPQIEALIGKSTDTIPHKASFSGVFIAKNGERYYPIPLNWLGKKSEDGKGYMLYKLTPTDNAIQCDIGRVRLPNMATDEKGAAPLEGCYVNENTLMRLLASHKTVENIAANVLLTQDDLFDNEPRLGIGRNNSSRQVNEGQLYQTKHLRLKAGISLQLDCTGWQPKDYRNVMTLGGEGRLTQIEHCLTPSSTAVKANNQVTGVILSLATPALFSQGWLLDGFSPSEQNGVTCWQGTINDIALTLHCATVGKAQREGGWDLSKHQSRAVESFVPAGSSYFCTADNGDTQTAINALHGTHIGQYNTLGRGKLVVGTY
jgi:CRISPR-associated protein Cmr3